MFRSIMIAILAMAIFLPAVQAQESFESTTCASGTANLLYMDKDIFLNSFDLKGIVRSDSNSEFLNNASEWCVGLFSKMGEKISQRGFCKYTSLNGDITLMEWDGEANGGNLNFVYGTGKWENIKGKGTWSMIQRAKSASQDTFQNSRKMKGTFELPK